MDERRIITNDSVFYSATQPILYSDCDWVLFWSLCGVCALAGVFVFAVFGVSIVCAVGLITVMAFFFAVRAGLRAIAKRDPLMVQVYWRHLRWPAWLPATSKAMARRDRAPKLFRRELRRF